MARYDPYRYGVTLESMNDALQIERRGAVITLWLNRPELHNAFDASLIARLTAALEAGRTIRSGPWWWRPCASFSAGADMQWMRGMAAASEADNREDSLALARLMRTLDELPKPTLARVHGAAFGGGVGLARRQHRGPLRPDRKPPGPAAGGDLPM